MDVSVYANHLHFGGTFTTLENIFFFKSIFSQDGGESGSYPESTSNLYLIIMFVGASDY